MFQRYEVRSTFNAEDDGEFPEANASRADFLSAPGNLNMIVQTEIE